MRWGQWRLWARVRGFLVLGGLAAASAAAAAPPQIPATWLAYAAQASDALGQRLARSEDADVARSRPGCSSIRTRRMPRCWR